jgi:prevent-host-death family protein
MSRRYTLMSASTLRELGALGSIKDIIVPTTEFNRGKASKIFEQVQEDGLKLIVKNNTPVCVLLSVSEYDNLIKELSKREGEE